jgi:branched-chain amino acid transport system substrate-binding protein
MNPTAVKEAAKINFPMDKFVSVYWGGGEDDARPTGQEAKGFTSLSFSATGPNFPALQDIQKHVIDKKKSQTLADKMGPLKKVFENLYGRGQFVPPAGMTVADMGNLHEKRVVSAQQRGTLRKDG